MIGGLSDAMLQRVAGDESCAWVERTVAELGEQGRPVEGGWPGTLSEARRLARNGIAREVRGSPSGPMSGTVTQPVIEELAKQIYGGARKGWLARAHAYAAWRDRTQEETS